MKKLLLLVATMFAFVQTWAHDFEVDGIYYNITSTDDKTVSVSYRGDEYDDYSDEYTGSVVIPESVTYNGNTYSVTSIGEDAFYRCSSLTSVTIPNSVTSIGDYAFFGCRGLTSVTIPNSVTGIGKSTFFGCSGLTSVTIPNSVTSIGRYAFYGCSGLTSVTIPNSVTFIGEGAFSNCSGLTSVTIPNSVTFIGEGAFSNCSGLTSVTIPNSVTSIGSGAFEDCSGLTSVTIPNSVTSIGNRAFAGCSGLTSIIIPDSVTSIGEYAFGYVKNIVYNGSATGSPWGALTLNGVFDGDFVYSDAEKTQLTAYIGNGGDVVIPESVTSIGSSAFRGCSGLTLVTIPNSVTSIGSSAFSSCSGLTSVTIPNSVTSIGSYAFYGCSGLTSVTIPNSVTSIGESAFFGCSGLTSVTIPNSVTSIGWYAFYGCSGLTSVTIPNSVTSIGDYAFDGCRGLTSVNTESIEGWLGISFNNYSSNPLSNAHHLFINGEEVTDVVVPETVTSINKYTFSGCWGLTSVTIPNSVTSIGRYAFYDCSGLTSVTIPESVTSIGENAFSGCSSLQYTEYENGLYLSNDENPYLWLMKAKSTNIDTLVVNDSCRHICDNAFSDCTMLRSVTIPQSVVSIGTKAFYNCNNIEYLNYNTEAIGSHFANKTNLTTVVVGDKVGNVVESNFSGCDAIVNFNAPESVVVSDKLFVKKGTCGEDAKWSYNIVTKTITISGTGRIASYEKLGDIWSDDTNTPWSQYSDQIETVIVEEGITDMGYYAFFGCDSIKTAILPSTCTDYGQATFLLCNNLRSVLITARRIWQANSGSFSNQSNSNCKLYVPKDLVDFYKEDYVFREFAEIVGVNLISIDTNIVNGSISIDKRFFVDGDSVKITPKPSFGYAIDTVFVNGNALSRGDNGYVASGINSNITIGANFKLITSGQCGDSITWSFDENSKLLSITGTGAMYDYISDNIPWKAVCQQYDFEEVFISAKITSVAPTILDPFSREVTVYYEAPTIIRNINKSYWYICNAAQYKVELRTNNDLYGSVVGGGTYIRGSSVTIKAVPADGYKFVGWSNGRTSATTSIYVYSDTTITAKFIFDNFTIDGMKYTVTSSNEPYTVELVASNYSELEILNIPSSVELEGITYSVTSIGNGAFKYCSGLTSVTIPNSVTSIGDYAFYNCSGLTSVTIPNSVISIEWGVFRDCSGLTSVTIPNSVTSIEGYAFEGCDNVTIYCEASFEPWGWSYTWNVDNRPVVWGYVGVDEMPMSNVQIYAYQNVIVVENANSEILVYDAIGRLVARRNMADNRIEIPMQTAGIYIVKVGNEAKRVMVQ